jgi:uncharacterized membrane protein
MKNKVQQEPQGFEFNWKNTLVIWLVIVFIAMFIGYRSKATEKSYQDKVDEVLFEENEVEALDLKEQYQNEERVENE